MRKDDEESWGRLGRIEKVFLLLVAISALLYFTGVAQRFQTLSALAPHNRDNPRIVLLTPGPYNETHFEHAYFRSSSKTVLH